MTAKLLIVPGIAAVLGLGLLPAEAATDAPVTVTIQAQGTDLSGKVTSTKPKLCAKNRTVVVYKQIGTRGRGDDKRFASDTTGLQNGVWVWSTGNTGTEGKFYAKVAHKTGCKRAFSKTIVAKRNP